MDPKVTASNGSIKPPAELEEKLRKFEERIQVNSWDSDAWSSIILEIQNSDIPINIARNYYERFLAKFPTAVNITFHL